MEVRERLNSISEEYGMALNIVSKYYHLLKDIPITASYGDDLLFDALETLVQDRMSESFLSNEFKEGRKAYHEHKPLDYSISYALYEVYGEEAMPYLDEEFINEKIGRKR